MRYQVTIAALVAASGLVVGASGCGQSKVSECNALIEVINRGVQSLEKPGEKNGAGELKVMAEAMDKVATDAAQVKLSLPELQKYSTEYQNMAKEVARAARDMAAASEAKDPEKSNSAQAAMEKAVKQEEPLVKGINDFCVAP
jgi:hypothetical protein